VRRQIGSRCMCEHHNVSSVRLAGRNPRACTRTRANTRAASASLSLSLSFFSFPLFPILIVHAGAAVNCQRDRRHFRARLSFHPCALCSRIRYRVRGDAYRISPRRNERLRRLWDFSKNFASEEFPTFSFSIASFIQRSKPRNVTRSS